MEFSGWTAVDIAGHMMTADLRRMGEGRAPGVHLSDCIREAKIAAGENVGEVPGDQPGVRMQEGFLWETALEYILAGAHFDDAVELAFKRYMLRLRQGVVKQIALERDGILMTPDGLDPMVPQLESYKCVAPETLVLTADLRWIPVGDVTVGMKLIGCSEGFSVRFTRSRDWLVADVLSNEPVKLPRYVFEFADGTEIVCSREHPWLRYDGLKPPRWAMSDNVLVGDYVAKQIPQLWREADDYEAGYLSAAFDGEGSLTQNRYGRQSRQAQLSLTFTQNNNAMLERVDNYLTKRGFNHTRLDVKAAKRLVLSRKYEALRFLGEMRPPRLMAKFDPSLLACTIPCEKVKVVRRTPIRDGTVMALATSTRTFVAEGYAAHNSTRRTLRHARTKEDFETHYWTWMMQEQGYCYAAGLDQVRWIVWWQAGDYSRGKGTGPVVMEATAKFEREELERNWKGVLAIAERVRAKRAGGAE